MDLTDRWTRLTAALAEVGADALLTTQAQNRRYLTGFAASDPSPASAAGWAVVGSDGATLITSALYAEEARSTLREVRVVEARPRHLDALPDILRDYGVRRLAFESEWLTVQQHTDLSGSLGNDVELVPTMGVVETLRERKDPEEIEAIAEAVALTDAAFASIASELKPGVTEREVAWALERFIRERGSEGVAFEVAVASGPASAVPHHAPDDRRLGAGEPIWIDMGARIRGYCGDLTRSFCLGSADGRYRELYEIVLSAQTAAVRGLRAGMTGAEADALARDVIAAAGLGDAFTHTLGHGIGLAVHENPRLSARWPKPLLAGIVTSVEPGIYIPGWGGIRIEDLVVLEDSGARVLTGAGKDLVIG